MHSILWFTFWHSIEHRPRVNSNPAFQFPNSKDGFKDSKTESVSIDIKLLPAQSNSCKKDFYMSMYLMDAIVLNYIMVILV